MQDSLDTLLRRFKAPLGLKKDTFTEVEQNGERVRLKYTIGRDTEKSNIVEYKNLAKADEVVMELFKHCKSFSEEISAEPKQEKYKPTKEEEKILSIFSSF